MFLIKFACELEYSDEKKNGAFMPHNFVCNDIPKDFRANESAFKIAYQKC